MARTSAEYWQDRFLAVEAMHNRTANDTVQSIAPVFDKAQAQIEKEINAWYSRFAKNNQIDMAEARRLLNSKELKEFKWDVEEYIKHGQANEINRLWMKELENASAKFHISRLEALKIRTQQATELAFGNELDQLDEMAAKIYTEGYYHTAYEIQKGLGIGWDVGRIDQTKLNKILRKPWTADKMTFSDRIWKSKTQLLDELHTELTQMCILGKDPQDSIERIAKRMNVSKSRAGALVMTECTYFGSIAQQDAFNDLDVERFEVVATLDSHTSDICRQMDGQVMEMKDFKAGVTAPPFHVRCRSCTVPWFEDNDDGTRAARGADGKTYQVPANMKYQDWIEHFVDKTKDPDKWLKPASVGDIVKMVQSVDMEALKQTTTKLKSKMSADDYDAFLNLLKEKPDVAKLYEYADELPNVSLTKNGGQYWYEKSKFEFSYASKDYIEMGMSKYHTLSHEYGHFIDRFKIFGHVDDASLTWSEIDLIKSEIKNSYIKGWHMGTNLMSNTDQFLSALRKDFSNLGSFEDLEKYCLENQFVTIGVQDAVDGLGMGRIWWGHGDKYYNREWNNLAWYDKNTLSGKSDPPTKKLREIYKTLGFDVSTQAKAKKIARQYDVASELWANLIAAETVGGKELETLMEKFPESYKVMKEMLKVVK